MKVRAFYEEAFCFEVHLLVGCTRRQFRDYVRKTIKPKYKKPGKFYAICHATLDHVIIGLPKWEGNANNIAGLSHELVHAVWASFRLRDIKVNRHTEEVFAYLHDSLLRRSLHALGAK